MKVIWESPRHRELAQSISIGNHGESIAVAWCIAQRIGACRLSQIRTMHDITHKGPALWTEAGKKVRAPDLLIWKDGCMGWMEVKTKNAFVWYWPAREWSTGIDEACYEDYLAVHHPCCPVYIAFVVPPGGRAINTPEGYQSPAGLFAVRLSIQPAHTHFTQTDQNGTQRRVPMVYWTLPQLTLLAEWPICDMVLGFSWAGALLRQMGYDASKEKQNGIQQPHHVHCE